MRHSRWSGGFTLIEVLVVVIIIAALAGMVLPHVFPVATEAKMKISRGEIAGIETALSIYRVHYDRYPTNEEGLDILTKPSTVQGWNGEPYLKRAPVDPWKNPYKYKYPGTHPPASFDIWSIGPDGKDGTGDDVANWDAR